MAGNRTGGRIPFDKSLALSGPARTLWAETTVAAPADLSDVIAMIADEDGEYLAETGWHDFGLAADAPSVSHDKESEGLEYQTTATALFEVISNITRSFVAQVAEIDEDSLKIIENSTVTTSVAAAAGKSAQTLVHTGLYESLKQYRIAMIAYRPEGAGVVIEPGGRKRPPAVARIIPLCSLAAEESELSFERGEPTNAEVTFTIAPDSSLGAQKEHGYWVIEQPGTIAAP